MMDAGQQGLLEEITAEFATLPEVSAVVLAGSRGGKFSDDQSDIDLYVYAETEPSQEWRSYLGRRFGGRISIGNHFWESGDEWVASGTGIVVDIMYRSPAWIEEQLECVLIRHQAFVGYSTCFVHNVRHSMILFDRDGWFASLQVKAEQAYPEPLRRAIIAKNHPVLRSTLSSYVHQIAIALERNDHLSVNHRITALLASYFDILFAINRMYHPGEKRLAAYVVNICSKHPADFQTHINEMLRSIASTGKSDLIARVNDLLDGLDTLLMEEQLISSGESHYEKSRLKNDPKGEV